MPQPPGRTALYRLRAEDGDLLYLGITVNPIRRWSEHRRDRRDAWWPQVRFKSVEWHRTRVLAMAAERVAIRTERPAFNVLHSEDPPSSVPPIPRGVQFGDASHALAQERFAERPFTTFDLFAAGTRSKAGTEQHVRALVERGLFIPVGNRANARFNGKPHTLYMLAGSAQITETPILQLASTKDGLPLLPEGTVETLSCAWQHFGTSGFFASQLTQLSRHSRAGVRKHLDALVLRGLLKVSDHRVTNKKGRAAKVFQVTPQGELALQGS